MEAGDNNNAIEAFIAAGNVVLRKKRHRYSLRETQKKLISSIQEKVLIEIEKERVEKLYAEALIERDAFIKMEKFPNLLPSQGVLKFNIIFSALMIVSATAAAVVRIISGLSPWMWVAGIFVFAYQLVSNLINYRITSPEF